MKSLELLKSSNLTGNLVQHEHAVKCLIGKFILQCKSHIKEQEREREKRQVTMFSFKATVQESLLLPSIKSHDFLQKQHNRNRRTIN